MIIKKDQLTIIIPEDHRVESLAIFDHNGLIYPLLEIPLKKMREKQQEPMIGRPTLFCQATSEVLLYPRADKEYIDVRMRLIPPVKEM